MTHLFLKNTILRTSELLAASTQGKLYAVLDACDSLVTYDKAREASALCLYSGNLDEESLREAPYLVRATPDLCRWIIDTVVADYWGILLVSNVAIHDIRKHLRKLLTVEGPDGDMLVFRYYDPRVIEPYLMSCTEDELRRFFGPIDAFGVAVEESTTFYHIVA
jgi:hypothetical protein